MSRAVRGERGNRIIAAQNGSTLSAEKWKKKCTAYTWAGLYTDRNLTEG